jgi:hypothetical protein
METITTAVGNAFATVANFLSANPMILLALAVVGGLWLFLSDDDDDRYRRGRGDSRYYDDRYDRDYR